MKPFHSVGYISEVQIKKDLSLFDPFIITRILFFLRVHASILETSHKVVCPSCYLFKNDLLGTEEPKSRSDPNVVSEGFSHLHLIRAMVRFKCVLQQSLLFIFCFYSNRPQHCKCQTLKHEEMSISFLFYNPRVHRCTCMCTRTRSHA